MVTISIIRSENFEKITSQEKNENFDQLNHKKTIFLILDLTIFLNPSIFGLSSFLMYILRFPRAKITQKSHNFKPLCTQGSTTNKDGDRPRSYVLLLLTKGIIPFLAI